MGSAGVMVGVMLLLGYGLASACVGGRRAPWWQVVGISLGLGVAALGLALYGLSLAGLAPQRTAAALVLMASVALVAVLAWRRRLLRPVWPRWRRAGTVCRTRRGWRSWGAGVALVLALAAWGLVAWRAYTTPLTAWDGYILWGVKSKAVATHPVRESPLFHDMCLGTTHLSYPLQLPFIAAGLNAVAPAYREATARLVCPLFLAVLLLALYAALRPLLARWQAAWLVALVAWLPAVWDRVLASEADVPLAALHAVMLAAAGRWLATNRGGWLGMAALAGAACAFTKNEGLVLAGVTCAALGLVVLAQRQHRRLRGVAALGAAWLLLLLPWLLWRRTLPQVDENYAGHLSLALVREHLPRVPRILAAMGNAWLPFSAWHGLWLLPLVGALLRPRWLLQRPACLFLWLLVPAQLAAYFLAYLIGPVEPEAMVPATFARLLLHLLPTAVLLTGSYWRALRRG